ncbi:MAG: ABC transporter ATP-binding protein [Lachnospiraceae bacterium]|nr:ABC transporter ATP-binding protein [Lachnospiraceae bacterium]
MFLEIKDVKKNYGKGGGYIQVLKGVSASLNEGQICVVLGASGSGKSTLLNIVGGIDNAESGEILVDGKDIAKLSNAKRAEYRRNYVGFVFQMYNLIPNLTLKENIEVCSYLSKSPLIIGELLDILGLAEHQNKYPSQLSGGQQQRCSVARALVKNPKLLLCDEPTGALDYKSSKEMLELFEKINQRYGTTMIIITHNEALKYLAHQIVYIKDGCIIKTEGNNPIPADQIEW